MRASMRINTIVTMVRMPPNLMESVLSCPNIIRIIWFLDRAVSRK